MSQEEKNNKPDTVKEKGSFLKGFLISLVVMIICLVSLGFTIVKNPEALGGLTFYCVIGVVITGLISKSKKMKIIFIILLAVLINIIALAVGFYSMLNKLN